MNVAVMRCAVLTPFSSIAAKLSYVFLPFQDDGQLIAVSSTIALFRLLRLQ